MSAIRPMPQSDPYFQEAQEAARDCKIQLPSPSEGVDTIVRLVRQKISELALQGHAKAEHHKRRFEMLDLEGAMQKINITIPPAGEDQLPDAFPPEVVGIIFSYLPPEADVTLPSVLATLSVNSDLARGAALLTRDSANKATAAANQTLLNILSQVIGGTTPKPDSATASALAHVHHVEGLNALFKKCTSANMLEQVILFLATHCPDLRQLDLSGVKNLGHSHLLLLSNFRLLHTLSLARTSIDDTCVEALQSLQLAVLNLSYTEITGSTLHTLYRGIQELDLNYCTRLKATTAANQTLLNVLNQVIGGTTPEPDSATASALAQVHHVEGLNALFKRCTSAKMLQQVIGFLADYCPDLRQLDLSGVKNLELSHLLLLSNFRLLHTLSLAKTSIDDTCVEALQSLQLAVLNLSYTEITGSTLHTLYRGIKELDLHYCKRLTDKAIEGLGEKEAADGKPGHAAMQLVKCDLSDTHINGGSTLHTLSRAIQELDLSYCYQLTDRAIEGLGEKKAADGKPGHAAMQLVKCNLAFANITGSTLHTLSRGIKVLYLLFCSQITDEGILGLVEKKDEAGKVLWSAMQLTRCSLPSHISETLRAQLPVLR